MPHTRPPTSRICAEKIQFGGALDKAEPGNTWNLRSRVLWYTPFSSLRPTWVGRPASRLRWMDSKRRATAASSSTDCFSRSPPLPCGERIEVRGRCSRDERLFVFFALAEALFTLSRKPGPSPRPSLQRREGDLMALSAEAAFPSRVHPRSCTTSNSCRCNSRHSRMRIKLRKCREHQSRSFDWVSSSCTS